MVNDNFAKAVTGAIVETQRQWSDFQSELSVRYGEEDAALMVCALTHDDPAEDCPGREWAGLLRGLLLAVTAALLATVLIVVHRRRRRRG